MSAVLDIPVPIGHRAPAHADATFASLFSTYEDRLLAFCRSILRDEHDARDAVQNTGLRALAGLRAGEVRSNPRAWLFTVARTESLMLLRRRRAVEALDGSEAGSADDPEARALAREAFAELVADLEALAPRARQALVLREAAGLEYAEIARVLDCTAGAARQAVSEARTALKADREARGADCASIREILDAADGRVRRGRSTRAHLRGCAACREWQASRPRRTRRLFLPPFIGFGWLEALLAGSRMEVAIGVFSSPPRGVAAALVTTAALGAGGTAQHRRIADRAQPAAVVATAAPIAARAPIAVPVTATAAPVRVVAATATPVAVRKAPVAVTPTATTAPERDAVDRRPADARGEEDERPVADEQRSAEADERHTAQPWDSSTSSAAAETSPSASPSHRWRSRPEEPSRFASTSPASSTTSPAPSASG